AAALAAGFRLRRLFPVHAGGGPVPGRELLVLAGPGWVGLRGALLGVGDDVVQGGGLPVPVRGTARGPGGPFGGLLRGGPGPGDVLGRAGRPGAQPQLPFPELARAGVGGLLAPGRRPADLAAVLEVLLRHASSLPCDRPARTRTGRRREECASRPRRRSAACSTSWRGSSSGRCSGRCSGRTSPAANTCRRPARS